MAELLPQNEEWRVDDFPWPYKTWERFIRLTNSTDDDRRFLPKTLTELAMFKFLETIHQPATFEYTPQEEWNPHENQYYEVTIHSISFVDDIDAIRNSNIPETVQNLLVNLRKKPEVCCTFNEKDFAGLPFGCIDGLRYFENTGRFRMSYFAGDGDGEEEWVDGARIERLD